LGGRKPGIEVVLVSSLVWKLEFCGCFWLRGAMLGKRSGEATREGDDSRDGGGESNKSHRTRISGGETLRLGGEGGGCHIPLFQEVKGPT